MNADEFQKCAERTMLADKPIEYYISNAALGLCEEVLEIELAADLDGDRSKVIEECGDLLWYVAQMSKGIGVTIGYCVGHPDRSVYSSSLDSLKPLYRTTSRMAGLVKKRIYHGKMFERHQMVFYLNIAIDYISNILMSYDSSLEEAFDVNAQKLMKRHPNGFSYDSANAKADEQ